MSKQKQKQQKIEPETSQEETTQEIETVEIQTVPAVQEETAAPVETQPQVASTRKSIEQLHKEMLENFSKVTLKHRGII